VTCTNTLQTDRELVQAVLTAMCSKIFIFNYLKMNIFTKKINVLHGN